MNNWREVLSWVMEEDVPFKDTPIKTAENARKLSNDLNSVSEGRLFFVSLPNVWNYREYILEKLKKEKIYRTQQIKYIIPKIDELLLKYEEWAKIE